MEMINKTAREAMEKAGVAHEQADAIAAFLPDWTQFATKTELIATKQEIQNLKRWVIAGFIVVLVLPDNWITQLLDWMLKAN